MLPSFISGSHNVREKRQTRDVGREFDGNFISVTKGDVFIYEAVRNYSLMNSPIEQRIDGRLVVIYEGNDNQGNTTKTSMSPTTASMNPTTASMKPTIISKKPCCLIMQGMRS